MKFKSGFIFRNGGSIKCLIFRTGGSNYYLHLKDLLTAGKPIEKQSSPIKTPQKQPAKGRLTYEPMRVVFSSFTRRKGRAFPSFNKRA